MLVTGELFPAFRKPEGEVEATEMTGVEHLGQYVYEMTQAKLKQLNEGKAGGALPQVIEIDNGQSGIENEEREEDKDGVPPEELED